MIEVRVWAGNWGSLETWRIACNGGKTLLPNPLKRLLASLDPNEVGRLTFRQRLLLSQCQLVVSGGEAASDEEDVAWDE